MTFHDRDSYKTLAKLSKIDIDGLYDRDSYKITVQLKPVKQIPMAFHDINI